MEFYSTERTSLWRFMGGRRQINKTPSRMYLVLINLLLLINYYPATYPFYYTVDIQC